NAKIIFVTTKANRSIVEKTGCVDKIIWLDDSGFLKLLTGFPGFLFSLISSRIDVFLDLEIYSNFSSLVTTLSMATNRIGYYLRSSHYRMGIYTHMMFFNTDAPVSQTYLQLARLLHCKEIIAGLVPLKSSVKSITLDGKLFELTAEKYIVINPNASDLRIERRWGKENFITLIGQLHSVFPGARIILTGNKKEAAYVSELLLPLKDMNVHSLAGLTSLDELISL